MSHFKDLKKSNSQLKKQLEDARRDIKMLQQRFEKQEEMSGENNGETTREAQIETEKSLEWLHDTETSMQEELDRLRKLLDNVEEGLGKLASAIDEMQEYSYAYNIKILGMPESKPYDTAEETSQLCISLFKSMGAQVSVSDIDIAHRLPTRDDSHVGPKPIFIHKFIP